jgi:drug/metabolite transporter (DMT)-like permease
VRWIYPPPLPPTHPTPVCPLRRGCLTGKAFTLALSLLVFPKPFTPSHGVGAALFFAGLLVNSELRRRERMRRADTEQAPGTPRGSHGKVQ